MKIYAITGQTATGKTAYAQNLAEQTNGELINMDARQAYRMLDIVTGKDKEPGAQFTLWKEDGKNTIGWYPMGKTRIWLYDMLDPHIPLSSIQYRKTVLHVLRHLINQGKTPILVGGTYLYLAHLLYLPEQREAATIDHSLRQKLASNTIPQLQELLTQHDPPAETQMNQSDWNNPHRLIRRIEKATHHIPDLPMTSSFQLPDVLGLSHLQIEALGFHYASRTQLRERITQRIRKRIEDGAVEETKKLLHHGYTTDDPGLQAIGYTQILRFTQEYISMDQLISEWRTKELQYAKRQYTFMKKDPHIIWYTIA